MNSLPLLVVMWSMLTAVCVLLSLVQGMVWLHDRSQLTYALSAIMAAGAAAVAALELIAMRTSDVDVYQTLLFWLNIAIVTILIPMVWFVHIRLRTGMRWLAILITAIWGGGLLVNIFLPGNLTFSEISAITKNKTLWGEPYSLPVGTENQPYKSIVDFASLLILVYVSHATIAAFRKGARKRAIVVGGSILAFIIIGGIHTPLVDAGLVKTPYMISFAFGAISFALCLDLVDSALVASRSQREIETRELRWRNLLENINLAVVGIDSGNKINFMNPFALKLTGYEMDQLTGQPVSSLVPESLRHDLESRLAQASPGEKFTRLQYPTRSATGAIRLINWSAVELRDSQGASDGMLAIGDDVTQSIGLEEKLRSTQREMERLTHAIILGELASAIAHELNQPLAAILSNAQAARRLMSADPPDTEEVKAIVEDIILDDKRAASVIDRMRALFTGGENEKEQFDVNEAILEVISLLSSEFDAGTVRVSTELARDVGNITAGKVEIQQVIMNLLINAKRALGELEIGERRVKIISERRGDEVSILVEDNGPGIPADKIDKIFDPFFTTKKDGIGVGLGISKRIAETHGGSLAVQRTSQDGACFLFSLPAKMPTRRVAHEPA